MILWPASDAVGWTTVVVGVGLLLASDLVTIRAVLEQGESLLPDLVRSLDGAVLATLAFGAPIGLTIWLSAGATQPLLALLLAITALAIASQVLAEKIQRGLDRVAFAALPPASAAAGRPARRGRGAAQIAGGNIAQRDASE